MSDRYQSALRERADAVTKAKNLAYEIAERADRMNASEARRYKASREVELRAATAEIERLDAQVDQLGNLPAEAPFSTRGSESYEPYFGQRRDDGPVLLGPEQRDGFTQWARAQHPDEFPGAGERELRFGKMLHGLVTGNWRGAEPERRALGEGTAGAGGVMVPTPLAASIIDKARNATQVLRAGARVIPMESATLKVPRLLTEPTGSSAWRNEAATIGEQNMTFDSVTFTAQSMSFYVKASRELIEDAGRDDGISVEQEIRRAFAAEVALELDRVALLGTGTAPQPRGVLNTSGITTTAHGTNGSVIGSPPAAGTMGWEFLVQALGVVRALNFDPNAQIMAPRTDQSLALLRDTTNQYIAPPRMLDSIPRLLTNQVPINVTVGTSTDTSYVFTGQWDQLWVGMRTDISIDVLRERFADTGQYAFLCWVRADVQVAQPAAFNVDTGVRS